MTNPWVKRVTFAAASAVTTMFFLLTLVGCTCDGKCRCGCAYRAGGETHCTTSCSDQEPLACQSSCSTRNGNNMCCQVGSCPTNCP